MNTLLPRQGNPSVRMKSFVFAPLLVLGAALAGCQGDSPLTQADAAPAKTAPPVVNTASAAPAANTQPSANLGTKAPAVNLTAKASPAASAPASTDPSPFPNVPGAAFLNQKMTYPQARQALLAHHWTPVVNPKCKYDAVGADYEDTCKLIPALCKVCNQLPELQACGSGNCLMAFSHAGQTLEIVTYGDIKTWNLPPPKYELMITGWDINPTPAQH
jgi:hypothetical protein